MIANCNLPSEETQAEHADKFRAVALDDETLTLSALKRILNRRGFELRTFTDPDALLAVVEADGDLDLAIVDVNMPKMHGVEVLRRIKAIAPSLSVVMLTSDASAETAVTALRAGAFNYLTKQHMTSTETVALVMKRAASAGRAERVSRRMVERVALADRFEKLVGASPPMRELYALVDRVAQLNVNVLLQGESGTGKELVARALHDRSERSSGPFVALSCAALPESLIDSELFGHTKGAFTGADRGRVGAFERAHGGTLLLDEIADISPAVQLRLLRVLQEGEVQRVGGNEPIRVDVRVVAATWLDLAAAVRSGQFRADLYYRVNVVSIDLPPLRERSGDVVLLAGHLTKKHSQRMGRTEPRMSAAFIEAIGNYAWPGNVRELENAMQRALAVTPGDELEPRALPKPVQDAARVAQPSSAATPGADVSWAEGMTLSAARKQLQTTFEHAYLQGLLGREHGNLSAAARRAGVDRSNLRRLLARHGLRAGDFSKTP